MDEALSNKGLDDIGVPLDETVNEAEPESNDGEAFTIDSTQAGPQAAQAIPITTNSFGAIALRRGWITDEQLKNAIDLQKQNKKKLGTIFIEQEILTSQQVAEILAEQLHIEFVDVRNYVYDGSVADLIPRRMIERYNVLPVKKQNNKIYIVTADPLDFQAIENIRLSTGLSVVPYLGLEEEIRKVIFQYFGAQAAAQEAIEVLSGGESDIVEVEDEDLSMTYNDAPIVSLVNTILESAIRENASDIHMEPTPINMRVRQRIDGMLHQTMMIPKRVQPLVTSRIKIMGKLDIAEKRRPQDGKIRVFVDRREVDIRLSSVPTIYGEKLVMRLLDKSRGIVPLVKLGFTEEESQQVSQIIKTPNGIILLCGPTGSGKTTTLYSILNELNDPEINITTIEDPVEYQLDGINQVSVNVKAGLTFASALRSFLRQDPDIIMVGEIRDRETAEIAVQAALTGHLVLSSIHTNDAPSTVSRLQHTGIEPFLISASLTGVVAQRLVRRVCTHCAREIEYDEEKLASVRPFLPQDIEYHFMEGEGCSLCHHTGYRGRAGIYEIMMVTPTLREAVVRGKDTEQLRELARNEGMKPLIESGMLKAAQGITTIEEVLRAARTEEEAGTRKSPRAISARRETHLEDETKVDAQAVEIPEAEAPAEPRESYPNASEAPPDARAEPTAADEEADTPVPSMEARSPGETGFSVEDEFALSEESRPIEQEEVRPPEMSFSVEDDVLSEPESQATSEESAQSTEDFSFALNEPAEAPQASEPQHERAAPPSQGGGSAAPEEPKAPPERRPSMVQDFSLDERAGRRVEGNVSTREDTARRGENVPHGAEFDIRQGSYSDRPDEPGNREETASSEEGLGASGQSHYSESPPDYE